MSVALESPAESPWPDGVTPTDEFREVLTFVRHGRGNLFVTGRAGTGKSTLLRAIVDSLEGRAVVAAPTGIAALNVGGETLHSLFRLPHGLLLDGEQYRSSPRDIFEMDDLTLIIDEASMVRSDVMNAIDLALRRQRGVANPFGGVRVIAFGDTHQLPPVVNRKREEDAKLRAAFGGAFFFHAPAARAMRVMELTHVFRQKDARFVALLNEIREGQASAACLETLNSRVGKIPREEGRSWSWLCPTNDDANAVNAHFLSELPGESRTYHAELTGEFASDALRDNDGTRLPADKTLTLKEGARVIFVRNDRQRRWVNGTAGIVTRMDDDEVEVRLDDGETHLVAPETWSKIKRVRVDGQMRDVEVGSMTQLPVRLGWGITIHKSQGMTLDRVYFAAPRRLFASGQAYVGLSRARSFEGLRLLRPLGADEVFLSPEATEYRTLLTPMIEPQARAAPSNVVAFRPAASP